MISHPEHVLFWFFKYILFCSHKRSQSTFLTCVDGFEVIAVYHKDFSNSYSCNSRFSVASAAQGFINTSWVGQTEDYSGLLSLSSEFNQKINSGCDQNRSH